jgi:hypothetical protein
VVHLLEELAVVTPLLAARLADGGDCIASTSVVVPNDMLNDGLTWGLAPRINRYTYQTTPHTRVSQINLKNTDNPT